MHFFRRLNRIIAFPVALIFAYATLSLTPAQAGLITTDQVIAGESAKADRARIASFLDRTDVRDQLTALGVKPSEAKARIATLSDTEVAQIAGRIDTVPAGQDVVGTLIGLLILAVIVLFITDLLGLTNVFPFIQPPATGPSSR